MYIKIDDDIVFIEDTAIPTIVKTKLEQPESFIVSANSINQPALSWIHLHLGVIKPYLPELRMQENARPKRRYDWRASDLPLWQGPADYVVPDDFNPFQGHRWLPTNRTNVDDTPVMTTAYNQASSGWHDWKVGAQSHYSFLEHLEKGELWRYHLPLWDYQYERLSVNFVCIWGDDVVSNRPIPTDDEGYLTVTAPKKNGRRELMLLYSSCLFPLSFLLPNFMFRNMKCGRGGNDG